MDETMDDARPMRLGLLVLSLVAVVAAAVAAVAVDSPSARAQPAEMGAEVGIPARVELDVLDSNCDNSGSTVEVSGSMSVLGQSVRIVLRNNAKGTHTATIVDELKVEVAPMEDSIEFPKQPVRWRRWKPLDLCAVRVGWNGPDSTDHRRTMRAGGIDARQARSDAADRHGHAPDVAGLLEQGLVAVA